MPPKRGRPAKSQPQSTAQRTSSKRAKRQTTPRKKTHANLDEREILAAFRVFAVQRSDEDEDDEDDADGVIPVTDVRRCLSALNLPKPPPNFFDPSQSHISYTEFLALAETLRDGAADDSASPFPSDPGSDGEDGRRTDRAADADREIDHAFALFTKVSSASASTFAHEGGRAERRITLADLKRVARELREEVDEGVLRLMIEEANGERGREAVGRGVGRAEFEGVMRRAGVFG